jgi:hypothetical protein
MSERERKDFGELVQLDGEASMTGGSRMRESASEARLPVTQFGRRGQLTGHKDYHPQLASGQRAVNGNTAHTRIG